MRGGGVPELSRYYNNRRKRNMLWNEMVVGMLNSSFWLLFVWENVINIAGGGGAISFSQWNLPLQHSHPFTKVDMDDEESPLQFQAPPSGTPKPTVSATSNIYVAFAFSVCWGSQIKERKKKRQCRRMSVLTAQACGVLALVVLSLVRSQNAKTRRQREVTLRHHQQSLPI